MLAGDRIGPLIYYATTDLQVSALIEIFTSTSQRDLYKCSCDLMQLHQALFVGCDEYQESTTVSYFKYILLRKLLIS